MSVQQSKSAFCILEQFRAQESSECLSGPFKICRDFRLWFLSCSMCPWEFEELFHGFFPHHTEFLVGWDQAIFLPAFNKEKRKERKKEK